MSYAPATFLPIQVCEALQQGLAPNLAHFCAKCILVAIKIGLGAIEFSFGVSWQDQTIGYVDQTYLVVFEGQRHCAHF